jgi:hypothetical protein
LSDKPQARRRFAQWLTWLFAGIGVIGLVAIIFLAMFVYDLDRPHQPAKVVDEKQRTTLTIGEPSPVPGTNLLEMDVSASEGDYGSLSSRNGDVRNILLVDRATGASRRLLPDNVHHIVQSGFYPADTQLHERSEGAVAGVGGGDESKAPAAYYLLAIRRDDDPQRQDVLIGILASGRQGVVMRGIDGIDQKWMMSPTQMGLIVRERLGLYYRVVDVPSFRVVVSKRIAID